MEVTKVSRYDAILLFVVIIWGANFGIVKTALDQIDPIAFSAARIIMGAPAMILVLFLTEKRLFLEDGKLFSARKDLPIFAGLSVLIACNYIFFTWGLAHTTSVNSSILYATCPLIIAVLSFVKEKQINRLVILGLALASVGVLLVIGAPQGLSLSFGSSSTIKGDLLTGVAVICWSLYPYFGIGVLDRYSAIRVTAYTMTGAAFLVAISLMRSIVVQPWGDLTWMGWAALMYSTVLAMVLSLVLWSYVISKIGPLKVIIYQYFVPVTAFILAVVLWREAVHPIQVLGGFLVLTGVRFVRIS